MEAADDQAYALQQAAEGLLRHFPVAWVAFMSKLPHFANVKVGTKRRPEYQIHWTRFDESVKSFMLSQGRFAEICPGGVWYVHLVCPDIGEHSPDISACLYSSPGGCRVNLGKLIANTSGYTVIIGEGTLELSKAISQSSAMSTFAPRRNVFADSWDDTWSVGSGA